LYDESVDNAGRSLFGTILPYISGKNQTVDSEGNYVYNKE